MSFVESSIPWPTDHDEKRHLIKNSLGPLVINWAENRLDDAEFEVFGPGLIHPLTREPWVFTDHQKRALILYYAHDDKGAWLYPRDVPWFAEVKRDRIAAAALDNVEQVGPSQLRWSTRRGWYGWPRNIIQISNLMWTKEAVEWHGLDEAGERGLNV